MTRVAFDQRLTEIQQDILVMGMLVQRAIERSIQALRERDVELAHTVIQEDAKINDKRYEIEEKCLELIATQQPLASDLRTIVAVLHVSVDLERMGDHAEGNAKVAAMLADGPPLAIDTDLPRMAEITIRMLMASLDAFRDRDAARARAICDEDDEVDALYDRIYHKLVMEMVAGPDTIERATHLTWVAHNLERIADRVTNICERVVYLVEGRIQELNVSKY